MASILVCATPAHGHIAAVLPVARHLHGAGHDVRFLTGRRYADRVRAAGIEFLPLPEEADLDLDDVDEAFPERAALKPIPQLRFSLTELFIRPALAQVRAIEAAHAERPVDVVVTEMMFIGAAALVRRPRAERPAVLTLGIAPLAARDPDVAPYGLGIPPSRAPFGRLRNRVLGAVAGRIFAPVTRAAVDAFRAINGSTPERFSIFDVPGNTDLLLQFTVPGFEYPRSTLADNVRFIGPMSRTAASDQPVPDWWGDLDGGRPVVHVTQGTISNRDFSHLVRPTIDALADEDVLVVATGGGQPVDALGPLPANARAAAYLPYDRLFPRLSAFVTNGGYQGLHFALEHGVPVVAAGTGEDKLETTARVGWSGAGINLRTARPKPEAIRDAVRAVLVRPSYREASARIGAEIAASAGLTGVDRAIAHLLGATARPSEAA